MFYRLRGSSISLVLSLALAISVRAQGTIDKRQDSNEETENNDIGHKGLRLEGERGPIWHGSPKRSDLAGRDSTWLLAAASAIVWGNPGIVTSKFSFGGGPDWVQSATITIFDQWQNQYQQEMNYSSTLFDDYSLAGECWWPAALESATINQQDGDWIQNGQFVNDQYTSANAATGLWKITGKRAEVTWDMSYDNVRYWLGRMNESPIVVKLKSTNRFYDVRGEVNGGEIHS
ncbi:uncharacterized protein I303_100114 [Kwoniella dejecticola CBS 10117]|uniref:Uncharacterized protein n=1 Tax=Kwoniella dejecticola CBS 10117 TaxID=1296121 RepID=A0AAJ8KG17_9TREE